MTINEMLHQVALLSGGKYSRKGKTGSIRINLPSGRSQLIYGRVQNFMHERMGMLFTEVGRIHPGIDLLTLLELNGLLKYSKVTVVDKVDVVLIAVFDLAKTSVMECAPILQELASVADELERMLIGSDAH